MDSLEACLREQQQHENEDESTSDGHAVTNDLEQREAVAIEGIEDVVQA